MALSSYPIDGIYYAGAFLDLVDFVTVSQVIREVSSPSSRKARPLVAKPLKIWDQNINRGDPPENLIKVC